MSLEKTEAIGGAGLLSVPLFDFFVWAVDTYGRGELLVSLHGHLPSLLLHPLVGFICTITGLGLLYRANKRQIALILEDASSDRLVDAQGKRYSAAEHSAWLKPMAIFATLAAISAPILAVAYSLKYQGSPPPPPALPNLPVFAFQKTSQPVVSKRAGKQGDIVSQTGKNNIFQHGSNNTATINPDVNPNKPVVTYDFDGFKRTTSPGRIDADDSEVATFKLMGEKEKSHDWLGLIAVSDEAKKRAPEWLTPYLADGRAYANLCDKAKAEENYTYFIDQARGSPTYRDAVTDAENDLLALRSDKFVMSCKSR